MAATKSDISAWFEAGLRRQATHMIVVCDTYDWEDFPVYVFADQDVRQIAADHSGPNMTRLMEVYDLRLSKENQLAEHRAFHY